MKTILSIFNHDRNIRIIQIQTHLVPIPQSHIKMSQNPDSVVNQGEFAGHVAPSEPMLKGGVSVYSIYLSA
jgi:hypothetical protein